jgi:hypothetical protein
VIPITLDKPRQLKFDIRACRELEAQLGKPLGSVIGEIQGYGVNAMVQALYIGLKHEDKSVTPGLAEKWFSAYVAKKRPMRTMVKKISDALDETGLFQKEEDVVEEDEGNAPAADEN